MYKSIILLIIFVGILFMTIEVVKIYVNAQKVQNTIEYRYIPRTFVDEQLEPVYPSTIFSNMFSQPSPWIVSIRETDVKKQEKINQYFVNQL
jgi:hypothetical protein